MLYDFQCVETMSFTNFTIIQFFGMCDIPKETKTQKIVLFFTEQ